MIEEIRVHVVKYNSSKNLPMRYRDPLTSKHVARTTGTTNTKDADRAAAK